MTIDLFFSDIKTRNKQYDARNSVADFNQCMLEYARLAQQSKNATPGIYNLSYGMGKAEKLDIFPSSQQPSPLFVFIHGGYWRAQSKDDACSMADNFVKHGIAVSTIEYTLAPTATLAEIIREVRSAIAWLYCHADHYGIDKNRIYVCGSSAGGHLVGMLYSDAWQQDYDLPQDVIKGVLALSGLYDLVPFCDIDQNEWLKLHPEQARRLSPIQVLPAPVHAPQLLLSVGELEVQGFHNQMQAYYQACQDKGLDVTVIPDQGHNHFDIVNTLADPESILFNQMKKMIQATIQTANNTQSAS